MAKISIFILIGVLLIPMAAWAEPSAVTSTDLIDKAQALDLSEVTYHGEVIGDIMLLGEHAWINVSDGANAIGIFVPTSLMQDVSLPGRYNMHGDEVSVTGTFHRACPEHGGDMDIHAGHVQLTASGYPVSHEIKPWKVSAAAVLVLANLALVFFARRKR